MAKMVVDLVVSSALMSVLYAASLLLRLITSDAVRQVATYATDAVLLLGAVYAVAVVTVSTLRTIACVRFDLKHAWTGSRSTMDREEGEHAGTPPSAGA